MTWHTGRICSVDVESSGTDVFTDRIVTAAISMVGGGLEPAHRDVLINPGVEIPQQAIDVHHITNEIAAGGAEPAPTLDWVAHDLCEAMRKGIPVVGFNVVFDLSMLDAELVRYGLPRLHERLARPVGPVICGLILDKHAHRYRKGSRKLIAVAEHYGVPLTASAAHGAAADALAAARVIWRIGHLGASDEAWRKSGFPDALWGGYRAISAMTLDELHAAQIGWYRAQSESLAAHFTKQGKTTEAASVDGAWPVRYAPATAEAGPP